ncbi:MAG: hypothetical protein AABX38_05415 [Candidatus Micrarchaeota archaeon]
MAAPGFKEKSSVLPVRTEDPINELHQTEKRHMAIIAIRTPEGINYRQVYEGGDVKIKLHDGREIKVSGEEVINGYRGNALGANLSVTITRNRATEASSRGVLNLGNELTLRGQGVSVELLDISEPQNRSDVSHAILKIEDPILGTRIAIVKPGLNNSETIRLPGGDSIEVTALRTFAGTTFNMMNGADLHINLKRNGQVTGRSLGLVQVGSTVSWGNIRVTVADLSEPMGETKYGAIFQSSDSTNAVTGLTKAMPGVPKRIGGQEVEILQVAPARSNSGATAAIELRVGRINYTQYLGVNEDFIIGGNRIRLRDLAMEY